MSRVVGQLLDIAELDNLAIDPKEKADLRLICSDVVEFVGPLALARKKELALTGADGTRLDQRQF